MANNFFSIASSFLMLIVVMAAYYFHLKSNESNRHSSIEFYYELHQLCGFTFEGVVAINSCKSSKFSEHDRFVAHFRICEREEVKIGLHRYDSNRRFWDRSRTLAINEINDQTLELRNLIRNRDGTLANSSDSGAMSVGSGNKGVQKFIPHNPV